MYKSISELKDLFYPSYNCLIVAGGPSGKDWEKHCDSKTFVIACNGSITKLAHRANLFISTEVMGWRESWAKIQLPDHIIRLTHVRSTGRRGFPPSIPVECSYHMAGFNPREYYNSKPIPRDIWKSENNWYTCFGKKAAGVDYTTLIEAGLLKGPVTRLGGINAAIRRQSTGTVLLHALHLACYMGFTEVRTIGADFNIQNGHHWFTDKPALTYTKGATEWSPDDNFVKVNGIPTLWFFAMAAAICAKKRLDFVRAGMTWRDMSDGLLQLPRIEHFFQYEKPEGKKEFWTYE